MFLNKFLAASSIALIATVAAADASAAVRNASSAIYFNSSGVVVGQQVTYCTSDIAHMGDVHQPYHVMLQWSCPDGKPSGASRLYPGTVVVQATFPPGVNLPTMCSQLEGYCEGVQGPDMLPGMGWPVYPGSGYDNQGNPTFP
ncbi:hypothetical protein [Luteibacter yeojuensis]|uniref:Uncharacterized protein n=1 Tax=Luteibacter yeojuensis TaxID=345309 RepID=A0A0F3KYF8_9GAMM|nr:hypothetical protein [Luteibacter yeojuensis]KJV36186.1 hypothetical protein VI08_05740 [Luteibacter yeojuensis]